MLLVIVKANLYGDNSFTTNGNFLVSNYGVKYNLLLTVNNIEILFKFKCGVDFVYLIEGSDKAQAKINDAIPHTWVDMEYGNTKRIPCHNLNKKWVLFVHPFACENCQIFYQGQCENTFSMSAERITTLDVAKIENNSQMNNHSFGVLPI